MSTPDPINSSITDNRFSRFDQELIDKYFNNKGKAAIEALIAEKVREELQWVLDNLDDTDMDCAEFYIGGADEGCDPVEHARRNARFLYRMTTEDLIEERIAQLKQDSDSFTVNRLEVIDSTGQGNGRDYVAWYDEPFSVELSEQDRGRTLKIFMSAKPGKDSEDK